MDFFEDLKDSLGKMKIDDLGIGGLGGVLGRRAGKAFAGSILPLGWMDKRGAAPGLGGIGGGLGFGIGGNAAFGLGALGALYLYNQYKQNQGGGADNILPEGGGNPIAEKTSPKTMPSNTYSGPNTGISNKQVANFLANYEDQGLFRDRPQRDQYGRV